MKWSILLGQFVTSKAVVDKIKFPTEYYLMIDQGMREMEEWSNLFKNLELDKPHTWVNTSLRVMRRIAEPEEENKATTKSLIFQFVEKQGYIRLDNLNTIQFYDHLIRKHYSDALMVIEGDQGILYRVPLEGSPDDFYFYELDSDKESDSVEIEAIPFLPSFYEEPKRRSTLNKALSDLYWEDRDLIKLDVLNDVLDFGKFEPPSRQYEGVLTQLYTDLANFKDKGIRRSILFQGKPGTGKSTLAFNLAEKLSKRTVVLSHNFLRWVTETQWEYILSILRPEMIIVDDIDRIPREAERRLFLFEDHYCNVPLILMTSNNYNHLPEAFKRPGRIDEMIEMLNPEKHVRYEVIRSIAAQEDVKIPDEKMSILDEIHENYPGAYIVELLRRVKAQGWNYVIPNYDLTFRDLDLATREKWNHQDVEEYKT